MSLQRFLDWPQNSLRPLDFGFAADGSASSAAQLLTWLRHRHIASNSSWQRELDFFADAVYWAFKHALITERAAVARGRLPDITVTINRNWLLLLPPSILNTAEHFYSQATGHQFRVRQQYLTPLCSSSARGLALSCCCVACWWIAGC